MPAVVFPTLAQVRQRVRFFIDEPTQANFTDSDLNYAINVAQQEVATEISQVDEKYFVVTSPTVITTVAGQTFYPLATDFWKMTRLEDAITGMQIDFQEFENQSGFFNGLVPPLVNNVIGYSAGIIGNSLALRPAPGASGYQLNYWYVPVLPDMTADTDQSSVPRPFIDLLAIQAAIDAKIKDEDDTAALERKYARRFQQLIRTVRDRQQQQPKHVTRVSGSGSGQLI